MENQEQNVEGINIEENAVLENEIIEENGNNIANQNAQVNLAAAVTPAAQPVRIRDPRRRPIYTEAQKRRAVDMLNMGITCRAVAKTLGPRCSSGTPIRWRKQFRQAQVARARIENAIRIAGVGGEEPVPDANAAAENGAENVADNVEDLEEDDNEDDD